MMAPQYLFLLFVAVMLLLLSMCITAWRQDRSAWELARWFAFLATLVSAGSLVCQFILKLVQ